MPRNVRNFWIEADIDGRESRLSGGPVSKDGRIDVTFKQRDNGSVTHALRVQGYARADGSLTLRVFDADDVAIHDHDTRR